MSAFGHMLSHLIEHADKVRVITSTCEVHRLAEAFSKIWVSTSNLINRLADRAGNLIKSWTKKGVFLNFFDPIFLHCSPSVVWSLLSIIGLSNVHIDKFLSLILIQVKLLEKRIGFLGIIWVKDIAFWNFIVCVSLRRPGNFLWLLVR